VIDDDASKSPAPSSQLSSPCVRAIRTVSWLRCARHQRSSWSTQCDSAALGDARSTK
jgi:hypothetical protein